MRRIGWILMMIWMDDDDDQPPPPPAPQVVSSAQGKSATVAEAPQVVSSAEGKSAIVAAPQVVSSSGWAIVAEAPLQLRLANQQLWQQHLRLSLQLRANQQLWQHLRLCLHLRLANQQLWQQQLHQTPQQLLRHQLHQMRMTQWGQQLRLTQQQLFSWGQQIRLATTQQQLFNWGQQIKLATTQQQLFRWGHLRLASLLWFPYLNLHPRGCLFHLYMRLRSPASGGWLLLAQWGEQAQNLCQRPSREFPMPSRQRQRILLSTLGIPPQNKSSIIRHNKKTLGWVGKNL